MIIPVSAKTGENLDKLKSSVLLLAEMLELRAPVEGRAQGVVIESKIERNCGVAPDNGDNTTPKKRRKPNLQPTPHAPSHYGERDNPPATPKQGEARTGQTGGATVSPATLPPQNKRP